MGKIRIPKNVPCQDALRIYTPLTFHRTNLVLGVSSKNTYRYLAVRREGVSHDRFALTDCSRTVGSGAVHQNTASWQFRLINSEPNSRGTPIK